MDLHESTLDVNIRANKLKGIGTWRRLYLRFFEHLTPGSILEVGCGDPSFLASFPADVRRLGLDGNPTLAERYAASGIEFCCFDFDREEPPIPLKDTDYAVCSDVFEHLLYPRIKGVAYHKEQTWGIDALHVGKTSGIGGLTLYAGDHPHLVQNPAGKGSVQFAKRMLTSGPVRAAVGRAATRYDRCFVGAAR